MSADKLLSIMRTAAAQQNNISVLPDVVLGEVTGVNPLKITIAAGELGEGFFILTRNVTDYSIEMTVNHATENTAIDIGGHFHGIPGYGTNTATIDLTHDHRINTTGGGLPTATESENPNSAHTHTIPGWHTDAAGNSFNTVTSHNHGYSGRKIFLVHNALRLGEKVIMMRMAGGNRFVVLDRVG